MKEKIRLQGIFIFTVCDFQKQKKSEKKKSLEPFRFNKPIIQILLM